MRPTHTAVLVFLTLALLEGVVRPAVFPPFLEAMQQQAFAASAISSAIAGVFFLLACLLFRKPLLSRRGWLYLLLLLLPQWIAIPLTRPYSNFIPWFHPAGTGVHFLLSISAPLWLALLATLRTRTVEVPRVVVAAAIAGIGAIGLVVPSELFAVAPSEVPAALISLLLNVTVVSLWVYVSARLAKTDTFSVAGSYLLLSGAGSLIASCIFERPWQHIQLHSAAIALLAQTIVVAASIWLWFRLLQHMPLPAFTMLPLAVWVASGLGSISEGSYRSVRTDAALTIAVLAIAMALRARLSDEQPIDLGLHSP